jgi:cell division protein FtsI (penicillin-binding protein 3)
MRNFDASPIDPRGRKDPTTNRLGVIAAILAGFWLLFWARACQVQVLNAKQFQERAQQQSQDRNILQPERGRIYDRNGEILADVYMREDTLPHKPGQRIVVKRNYERIYPWGSLGANLIGRVYSQDGHGQMGIEKALDKILYGQEGWRYQQRDARGRQLYGYALNESAPIPGRDAILTMDRRIQEIAEQALLKGVEAMKAKRGNVVVMDPHSGDVLAMATWPSFDPNNASTYSDERARNDAIQKVYEPGSTIKIITAAAALEEKKVKPEDWFNGEGGRWVIAGRPLNDHHPYQNLTFRQAFTVSSNIVFAKVGMAVGERNLFRYLRNFGFGMRTGIELIGEEGGRVHDINQWSQRTLATLAYGYELSVTPLQMAMAYSAIANGGDLLRPRIVLGWKDLNGSFVPDSTPNKLRRVISPETAHLLQDMARDVVEAEDGTATNLRSNVVPVGGKTGTAKVYDPKFGGYVEGAYNCSFAGFVPAQNPRYVIVVVVDEPQTSKYGGTAAGPIFKDIAENLYRSPTLAMARAKSNPSTPALEVPQVRGQSQASGIQTLRSAGLSLDITGEGPTILAQIPSAGTGLHKGDTVKIWLGGDGKIPNLTGLPAAQAKAILKQLGLNPPKLGDLNTKPTPKDQKPGTSV